MMNVTAQYSGQPVMYRSKILYAFFFLLLIYPLSCAAVIFKMRLRSVAFSCLEGSFSLSQHLLALTVDCPVMSDYLSFMCLHSQCSHPSFILFLVSYLSSLWCLERVFFFNSLLSFCAKFFMFRYNRRFMCIVSLVYLMLRWVYLKKEKRQKVHFSKSKTLQQECFHGLPVLQLWSTNVCHGQPEQSVLQ